MKNLTNTLSLILLSINITETSPIAIKNTLALIKTHSSKPICSTASVLKEKITQNIPQDLSPKTIDSKKALLFGTVSSIDPVFALGSAFGVSVMATAHQIGINYFNQPKPEDKSIENPETIKENDFKRYTDAIRNPFDTANKRAKLAADRPETHILPYLGKMTFNDAKNITKKGALLGIPTGITLNSLATNLGPSLLDGYSFGVNTICIYTFHKFISHLKSIRAEQKELQEPENLAQLSEEFNKIDRLLENDSSNALTQVKNQEQK